MHHLIELFKDLTNSGWIIDHGGLYIVMFIIFAETGLFAGFFLPGDSLLFISGIIIRGSQSPFHNDFFNLVYWILLITICGVLGNIVGYWFGKKSGPILYTRKDTLLFKQKHLTQAHEFYEKRGAATIILARFLPIVRTFAPIVAGIVGMNYKKFISYNFIGCIAWVTSMVMIGYVVGDNEWVKNNLDKIVILLILVTTAPVLFKMFFSKKKVNTDNPQNP